MHRTSINPVSWSLPLGFDQAQLVEGQQRVLVCSGQDSVDADGNVQHPGDMAAQLELSLDNLDAVLTAAGMTLANVVRLNVYTTDMDQLGRNWASLKALTLVGTRPVAPGRVDKDLPDHDAATMSRLFSPRRGLRSNSGLPLLAQRKCVYRYSIA